MYYFAYGSNLNLCQMKDRCPQSEKVGGSILFDYQLLFRSHNGKWGYLTIQKSKGHKTPIGIYEITEDDEEKLDYYEGVSSKLYRKEMIELNFENEKIKGLIYIMNRGVPLLPTEKYYNTVLQGYKNFKFDIKCLESALKECQERS